MLAKTDNPNEVGMHVFERRGLGRAPFKCFGMLEKKFQACPDAPVQPGACCDYCGTGIMYCYQIRSRDGKIFEVGSECVNRSGDAGLIKAYKSLPEVRALNRQKARAKDQRVIVEWQAIMADADKVAKLAERRVKRWDGNGDEDWVTFAKRAWGYCGASGRARYLKSAKRALNA